MKVSLFLQIRVHVLVVFSPLVSQSGSGGSIPTQPSDLTLSYISLQCTAVSPHEQVAWIIDACAERTRPAHGKDTPVVTHAA